MITKIKYSVDEPDPDNAYCLDVTQCLLRDVAESAAENYHFKHGGWDNQWPIKIFLFDTTGVLLGEFTVERVAVPQFKATEIKKIARINIL